MQVCYRTLLRKEAIDRAACRCDPVNFSERSVVVHPNRLFLVAWCARRADDLEPQISTPYAPTPARLAAKPQRQIAPQAAGFLRPHRCGRSCSCSFVVFAAASFVGTSRPLQRQRIPCMLPGSSTHAATSRQSTYGWSRTVRRLRPAGNVSSNPLTRLLLSTSVFNSRRTIDRFEPNQDICMHA